MGELSHISSEFDIVSNIKSSSFVLPYFHVYNVHVNLGITYKEETLLVLQGRFLAYIHLVTIVLSLFQADCSLKCFITDLVFLFYLLGCSSCTGKLHTSEDAK